MSIYYVVGGLQKENPTVNDEFHGCRKGIVLKVDTETRVAEFCLQYISPPEACPDDDPSIYFTAATVDDGKIYICTKTEILIYNFPSFEPLNYISLPCFNDLHHVRPTRDGNLLVVNTGLDMVQRISLKGEILDEWDVLGEPLWTRFSKETDYRKVLSTKPHKSHPNYVFSFGEEYWVTRSAQKDAICLQDNSKKIEIGVEQAHDGKLYGSRVYFTTVDGHLVTADTDTLKIADIIKLNRPYLNPGWCRGLHVVNENLVVVGFTGLRFTQWDSNLSWLKGGVKAAKKMVRDPTSIAMFDLKKKKMLWNVRLDIYGIRSIFSIHPELK